MSSSIPNDPVNETYVIITPVYNEEKCLEKTIETVVEQSLRPITWVIVDDDSTDTTPTILKEYAQRYPWIKVVHRRKEIGQSYYASNVYAILQGIQSCQGISYDYLAILDGDISLPRDYYERLLGWMQSDKRIGIASGVYMDNIDGRLRRVLNDRRSTPKALMVFRKQCYKEIGGFLPMQYGGEDTCACFMARMKNWKTWSFPNLVAVHNKPVGTGHSTNLLKIRFRQGISDYFLAAHPLFFLLKSIRRCIAEPPLLVGGLARMCGYLKGYSMGEERQLPDTLIQYIREEHLSRVFRRNKIPAEHRVDVTI